jgi:hypothetical protein
MYSVVGDKESLAEKLAQLHEAQVAKEDMEQYQ